MRILVKIASLQSQFVVLDEALKVTNRRVNALEFIQIPKILNIIAWIESELDEESREDFFRLKKVQDNKKRDKKKAAMVKSNEDQKASGVEEEELIPTTVDEMDEEDDDDLFV